MRCIVFALPLLAASAVLAQAQVSKPPADAVDPRPALVQRIAAMEMRESCPVGMSARQQGGGQTLWTIAMEDAGRQSQFQKQAPGQAPGPERLGAAEKGVHVELKAGKGAAIRQVELAVDYLAPGLRMELVNTAGPGGDLQKTYNLAAADGGSLRLAGDLLVGDTAGVTRVTLLRIAYADGTSWHASEGGACSVAPNGFKLVGSR